MARTVSRRVVLVGGLGLASTVLTGCTTGGGSSGGQVGPSPGDPSAGTSSEAGGDTGGDGDGDLEPGGEPGADPDVALLALVLADQQRVLAGLRATTRRHPALAPRLAPAVSTAARQVESLQVSGSSVAGPGGHGDTVTRVHVPASPARAMERLRADLGRASKERVRDCVTAVSGPFAGLLASMAAGLAEQVDDLQERP